MIDEHANAEWRRFRRVWLVLAFASPLIPFTVSVFPIFVASFIASRSQTAVVAVLVLNVVLNIVLLIPLFSTARQLRMIGATARPGSAIRDSAETCQVVSMAIGAWVVLMTLLGVVGWFFVG